MLIIGGPTASGKSALAVAVAEALGGVVINADSMQVYRELAILTNRPPPAVLARVPHRLYGFLAVSEVCSVGRWREMALREIAACGSEGRLPVIAGGTGLYLRALVKGLAAVPEIPEAVRRAARVRHAELGGEAFHGELARRDPQMAARLVPIDAPRLIRAWEVVVATGNSLAQWLAEAKDVKAAAGLGRPSAMLILTPPREQLYEACNARFLEMIARGALGEARRLDELAASLASAPGRDPDLPALKALGVPELRRHLHGETTLEEAVAQAQRATRRYAKRQLTWFRHQVDGDAEGLMVIDARFSEDLLPGVFSFLRRILLTSQK